MDQKLDQQIKRKINSSKARSTDKKLIKKLTIRSTDQKFNHKLDQLIKS